MRVLMDDMPCDLDSATIARAIAAAAAHAAQRGRVVVDVFIDGRRWDGESEAGSDAEPAAAHEIRFVSCEPGVLVAQALIDSDSALAEADELQRQAAHLIQSDDLPAALESLGEAVGLWTDVQQAIIDGAALLGLTLDDIQVRGEGIAAIIVRLNERLHTIRRALKARDPVTLADALLYDMPDVVDEWRGVLAWMRARTGSTSGSDAPLNRTRPIRDDAP
jgi:hypothetical protein